MGHFSHTVSFYLFDPDSDFDKIHLHAIVLADLAGVSAILTESDPPRLTSFAATADKNFSWIAPAARPCGAERLSPQCRV